MRANVHELAEERKARATDFESNQSINTVCEREVCLLNEQRRCVDDTDGFYSRKCSLKPIFRISGEFRKQRFKHFL